VQDFDVISIVMNSGTYLKLNAIMENERKVFCAGMLDGQGSSNS
jgi:hypothetical protein